MFVIEIASFIVVREHSSQRVAPFVEVLGGLGFEIRVLGSMGLFNSPAKCLPRQLHLADVEL